MKRKLNIGAVCGLAVSLVIIILAGVMLGGGLVEDAFYSSSSQFHFDYSFGADFYTEMFSVTYAIMEQLNEMSGDMANNMRALQGVVEKVGGMLLMGMGLAVLGVSAARLFTWVPEQVPAEIAAMHETLKSIQALMAPEKEEETEAEAEEAAKAEDETEETESEEAVAEEVTEEATVSENA